MRLRNPTTHTAAVTPFDAPQPQLGKEFLFSFYPQHPNTVSEVPQDCQQLRVLRFGASYFPLQTNVQPPVTGHCFATTTPGPRRLPARDKAAGRRLSVATRGEGNGTDRSLRPAPRLQETEGPRSAAGPGQALRHQAAGRTPLSSAQPLAEAAAAADQRPPQRTALSARRGRRRYGRPASTPPGRRQGAPGTPAHAVTLASIFLSWLSVTAMAARPSSARRPPPPHTGPARRSRPYINTGSGPGPASGSDTRFRPAATALPREAGAVPCPARSAEAGAGGAAGCPGQQLPPACGRPSETPRPGRAACARGTRFIVPGGESRPPAKSHSPPRWRSCRPWAASHGRHKHGSDKPR